MKYLLSICFLILTIVDASKIQLSKAQKDFLRKNKKIILGIDKSLKPFVIENSDKTLTGFDLELINRINTITGGNFVLKLGNIENLRKQAMQGKIHGLASYTPIKEEKEYFDFTTSYLQKQKLILTSLDNQSIIKNLTQLKGKTIALHKHNLLDKQIVADIKELQQKEFETVEETIMSIVTRQSDYMLSNGSVFYIINELGLPNVKPVYRLNTLTKHRYIINKDYPQLVSILNKALKAIGEKELLSLKNRWFSKNLNATLPKEHKRLVLSFKQKEHLISLPNITMCKENIKNPSYDKYINVNDELITQVEKILLKSFETVQTKNIKQSFKYLQQNKCDVIAAAIKTEKNSQNAIFSNPYLEIPIVLATQDKSSTIVDINYLKNFKVAVLQSRGIVSNVLNRYENLTIQKVKSLDEAFDMLKNGDVDAVAGALGVLSEQIKRYSYNFKINGTFNEKLYLTFAFHDNDKILKEIFNKAINQIPKSKKENIMNRYFGVKYEKGIDYTLIWMISTPLFVALFFYLLRVYDLKKLNKELQILVDEELEKSRKKDNLIFQQNKLVATGELIATITHQWKQPLSELGMSQNLLMTKIENTAIEQSELLQEIKDQQKTVTFMSKTINTFKEFFQEESLDNKKTQTFKAYEAYEDIEFLICESLELNSIKIEKQIDKQAQLKGDKNALSHLFLAIVQNSIFFLKTRKIQNPYIKLKIYQDEKDIIITIEDNAKGVESARLDFIFDFNYSFRDEKQKSTGLGLYICKMIVTEKYSGSIKANNNTKGLKIQITLPKNSLH
ncbi:MAG: transporter substrate-binding domain-containing protein [Campylobacterota bacterium]